MKQLDRTDLETDGFLELLHEAVEMSRDELLRIRDVELPGLRVVGVVDDERVVAFAAWDAASVPLVLEYIAVDATHRGRGLGRQLIDHISANGTIEAETDADAVEFYRRLGFTVTDAGRDARWPDRRRYRCVLESGHTV